MKFQHLSLIARILHDKYSLKKKYNEYKYNQSLQSIQFLSKINKQYLPRVRIADKESREFSWSIRKNISLEILTFISLLYDIHREKEISWHL